MRSAPCRHWLITIDNPVDEYYMLDPKHWTFLIYRTRVGRFGRLTLHGYGVLKYKRRHSALRRLLRCDEAHVEPAHPGRASHPDRSHAMELDLHLMDNHIQYGVPPIARRGFYQQYLAYGRIRRTYDRQLAVLEAEHNAQSQ